MTEHQSRQNQPSVPKKLDELHKLIDGMGFAMLTTRNEHGQLVSRSMRVAKRLTGADLWFLGNAETHKFDDIGFDPNVNCSFYKDSTGEWASVAGTAKILTDEETKKQAWTSDVKMWFQSKGGNMDGSASDPRLQVIAVEAHTVHYSIQDKSTPMVLWEYVKGAVTGQPAVPHGVRELDKGDLGAARHVNKI